MLKNTRTITTTATTTARQQQQQHSTRQQNIRQPQQPRQSQSQGNIE